MTIPQSPQRKSADALAFEHYLRTGERLTAAEWLERHERKFNPYHDERGRFTFATGAARMTARPENAKPARTRVKPTPKPRPTVRPQPQAETKPRRIAPIEGYPEDGKTSWRSANDLAFSAAANFYNRKYGLKPGDQGYRTPEFMKAWAMRESGGEGDRDAFLSDPFQVNNPKDWDDDKTRLLGLKKYQKMTPAKSAYAALEWLRYKAAIHDGRGRIVGFRTNRLALERYNTVPHPTRQSGGLPHKVWYARTILQMASEAEVRRK